MALEDEITGVEADPTKKNIWRRLKFIDAINDNLTVKSLPTVDDPTQIKRRLAMIAKALLKNEIETDPEARGYAGKTHAEIRDLLILPWVKTVQIPDGQGGFVQISTAQIPRISVVLDHIPLMPNTIRASQIAEILA